MLLRGGIPDPGSFGSTFFFLPGGDFVPAAPSPSGATRAVSRGVPSPRMLASSAIRLAAARFIAPGSFVGSFFAAGTGAAASLHPHEPLPQPPSLFFAGVVARASGAFARAAGTHVVSMSSGGTMPTSPVFQLIGSTGA